MPCFQLDEERVYVPLPLSSLQEQNVTDQGSDCPNTSSEFIFEKHPAVRKIVEELSLQNTCGYLTLINLSEDYDPSAPENISSQTTEDNLSSYVLFDCNLGIPLFDRALNRKILNQMEERRLCSSESLGNLIAANRNICLKMETFLGRNENAEKLNPGNKFYYPFPKNHIYHSYHKDSLSSSSSSPFHGMPRIPFPCKPFLFSNGQLIQDCGNL